MNATSFRVFVNTLTGKVITLDVLGTDTVLQVKERLAEEENISVENQALIFCGQELTDEQQLAFYRISPQSTLHLVLRLSSGLKGILQQAMLSADPSQAIIKIQPQPPLQLHMPYAMSDEPAAKRMKTRGKYTKRACVGCKNAHAACNDERPCKRCVQLGIGHTCTDAVTKKTRKRTHSDSDTFYPSLQEYLPILSQLPEEPPLVATPGTAPQTPQLQLPHMYPAGAANQNQFGFPNGFHFGIDGSGFADFTRRSTPAPVQCKPALPMTPPPLIAAASSTTPPTNGIIGEAVCDREKYTPLPERTLEQETSSLFTGECPPPSTICCDIDDVKAEVFGGDSSAEDFITRAEAATTTVEDDSPLAGIADQIFSSSPLAYSSDSGVKSPQSPFLNNSIMPFSSASELDSSSHSFDESEDSTEPPMYFAEAPNTHSTALTVATNVYTTTTTATTAHRHCSSNDELLRELIAEHFRQEKELTELRMLVAKLQNLLINNTQPSMDNGSSSSAAV